MNGLFERTGHEHGQFAYYTWCAELESRIGRHAVEFAEYRTSVHDLRPDQPYGLTYTVDEQSTVSSSASLLLTEMASRLRMVQPPAGLVLLRDLVSHRIPPAAVHGLFALLARHLGDLAGGSAFHSPISSQRTGAGFPLHADLFSERVLFNVITEDSGGDGGEIALLSAAELRGLMAGIPELPPSVRHQIERALGLKSRSDSFDEVFALMYGSHDWVPGLRARIEAAQHLVPATCGTGYLLVDGEWLHGRTAASYPIRPSRLQRLVFDSVTTENWQSTSERHDSSPQPSAGAYKSPIGARSTVRPVRKSDSALVSKAVLATAGVSEGT